MKKILCATLVLALLCCLLPAPALAVTSGPLTYFIQDGAARIEKCDPSVSGNLVIPDILGGYPVKGIHGYAFNGCSELTGVTIPDTVTFMDEFAFRNCPKLTTVTLGKGLYAIGHKAFYECTGLEEINYNAVAARDMSSGAFYHAGKDSVGIVVNVGKDVTRIPAKLFYNSTTQGAKIVQINFAEDGVCRRIGDFAFGGCTELSSITIPASVTTIGNDAFYGCSAVEEINFNATAMGDLTPGMSVFNGIGSNDNGISVRIGKNVTKIPDSLFGLTYPIYPKQSNTPRITKVVFEEGSVCTRIGNSAFRCANKLTQITLPESVKQIGDYAFDSCINLTSISIPNSVTRLGKGFLDDCDKLPTQSYENAKYLGTAENPYFMLISGSDDFDGTKIHKDTKMIGRQAFYFCTGLSEILFPDGLICIGDKAFSDTDLTSVSIPDTVTNIEPGAFTDCNLTYHIYENGKYLGNAENPYVVLTGAVSKDIGQIDIHKDTKIIGGGALGSCSKLTAVSIPDGVVTIDNSAFMKCGLTSVFIPETVTELGIHAFYSCPDLTKVTISGGVNRIETNTFAECRTLKTVILSEGVDYIEESAFYVCENLKTLSVPVSLTSIDIHAFNACPSLSNVYYGGTELQRDGIFVGEYNNYLEKATWRYNQILDPTGSAGDLTADGLVNSDDVVQLLLHISMPDLFPITVNADFTGDGKVTSDDVVQLLLHISMPDLFPLG